MMKRSQTNVTLILFFMPLRHSLFCCWYFCPLERKLPCGCYAINRRGIDRQLSQCRYNDSVSAAALRSSAIKIHFFLFNHTYVDIFRSIFQVHFLPFMQYAGFQFILTSSIAILRQVRLTNSTVCYK